jgi:SAM-dependent methyltransferase
MNDFAVFRSVLRAHGLAVAAIKLLARFAGKRVLVEGLDTDFPRPPPPRDQAMPTMDDAGRWHTGYGGRWKYVLPLPNERMMLHIGASSVDNFFFVADAWAQILSRYIAPHSHVMDVGCGCGRTARLLVNNPHVERFTGFDVFVPYVEWCARFFGELYPQRFSFHHLDVRTERYNPGGSLSCATAQFPAADRDVDVVFAASVFTHLYPDDSRSYLREMRRVLKPSGTAVLSFHDHPADGQPFSGSEHRADYDTRYMLTLLAEEGFALAEDIGDVCGQHTLALRLRDTAS